MTNSNKPQQHLVILTPEEVAERLKIPLRGCYTLLKKRELKHFRVGKLIRVLETDLVRYINDSQIKCCDE